jgi:tRNA-binding protein
MEQQNIENQSISWSDFEKVDIRVGTVIDAKIFEGLRNPAYQVWIDFGELGIKKSSAQITIQYRPEDIIGMQVVAVVNFPPKQISTFMSECLMLGVMGDQKLVTLLSPTHEVTNGQRIG